MEGFESYPINSNENPFNIDSSGKCLNAFIAYRKSICMLHL